MDDLEGKGGCMSRLVAIPVLALFLGVAILFVRIAQDWDKDTTKFVVGGLVTTLGVALGLFALAFGVLAGVGIYRRMLADKTEQALREQQLLIQQQALQQGRGGYPMLPGPPPQVGAGQQGSWYSLGPGSYQVWREEEEEPVEGRWQRLQ